MDYPRQKSIRLEKNLYQGPMAGFATICSMNRFNLIEAGFANEIIFIFKALKLEHYLDVLAFCLMPDHIHFILELKNNADNFLDVVHLFKQKSAFKLRDKHANKMLWQKRFMDRIIRDDIELVKYARYIFDNPVRKDLVDDFREWSFSGGYYFELWRR